MLRVVVIFLHVTGLLAFEIHFVLLHVGGVDVIGAHAEDLGHADEEMEKVHNFHTGVLFIELLVFGPPFPRDAVGELGHLLRHGAGVVQYPLGLFLFRHAVRMHADAFIERLLHPKKFPQLVWFFHAGNDLGTGHLVQEQSP